MRFPLGALLLGGLATVVLLPARASAEPYIAAGIGPTWLARVPSIKMTEPLALGSRAVEEGDLANRGSLVTFGGYFDGGITITDRLVLPLFGLGFSSAVGSYDEVLTSRDGSLATLRPWSTYGVDVLLPGVGYRAKHRRWMIEADARAGLAALWEGGSLVDGAATKSFEGQAVSFLFLGHVMGCRRLDPEQRLCLEAMPRLYAFGWWNGATFGLRWEAGR